MWKARIHLQMMEWALIIFSLKDCLESLSQKGEVGMVSSESFCDSSLVTEPLKDFKWQHWIWSIETLSSWGLEGWIQIAESQGSRMEILQQSTANKWQGRRDPPAHLVRLPAPCWWFTSIRDLIFSHISRGLAPTVLFSPVLLMFP